MLNPSADACFYRNINLQQEGHAKEAFLQGGDVLV